MCNVPINLVIYEAWALLYLVCNDTCRSAAAACLASTRAARNLLLSRPLPTSNAFGDGASGAARAAERTDRSCCFRYPRGEAAASDILKEESRRVVRSKKRYAGNGPAVLDDCCSHLGLRFGELLRYELCIMCCSECQKTQSILVLIQNACLHQSPAILKSACLTFSCSSTLQTACSGQRPVRG